MTLPISLPPTIGSLFSGYGGLDHGIELVLPNTHLQWYAEIEKYPSKVLEAQWPDAPNLGDVTVLDWTNVPPVDILTGGYPCQPFSHAGYRKGSRDERHLWPYVRRAINVLDPAIVMLENVTGHLSLGFDQVVEDITSDGWEIYHVVNTAQGVGSVHTRRRLFIMIVRDKDRARQVLKDGDYTPYLLPEIVQYRMLPTPTASDYKRSGSLSDQRRKSPPLPAYSVHFPHAAPGDKEFGDYTAAVKQWESLTRPAPAPVTDTERGWRTSVEFFEWVMGLKEGLVSGLPIPRSHQIKMLGNGVVPQQAADAFTKLHGQVF